MKQTVWQAARTLVRSPWFTATAVLTLALGIGAITAIFSVVYGVLLKPLPFPEPDRLVGLYQRAPGINEPVVNQGPATYFTFRDNQRAFEEIGAWDRQERSILAGGEPERVQVLAVSASMLPLLRVQPALGRLFDVADDAPGKPLKVILTHAYWQRAFNGARDVIGQPLLLDGAQADIVGVLPASFRFLRTNPGVVVPLQLDRSDMNAVSFGFQGVGRLRPGSSIADANADVARMIPLLNAIPGYASLRLEPHVRPLAEDMVGDLAGVLWILLATVCGVLVIACANVANLFLVRAEERHQQLAIRAALGASRGRLARELLAESLVVGLLACAVGLVLAEAGLGVLRRLAPDVLPRMDEIGLDPAVVLVSAAVALASALAFGLTPVVRLRGVDASALRESRGGTEGPVRQRTRTVLAAAQVAMALVLLIGSALMVRTFVAMRHVSPGFERPEEVQTFRISIPGQVVPDDGQFARTHEQIADRLRQLPGVASVGLASHVTMDGENNANPLVVEDSPVSPGENPPLRRFKTVGPGYFLTMGTALVAGRDIGWADIHQRRRVAVVSASLAREYWRTPADALGRRIRSSEVWYEIVGVSGDERDDGLNRPSTPIVYWPLVNDAYMARTLAYVVRSPRVGAPGFTRELRQSVRDVNPTLPLAAVETLDEIRARSMAPTSFAMAMIGIAAVLALLLGIVGVYGVVAYLAARRTREIGIRMALGASSRDVRHLLLRHGLLLTAAGIGSGVVISIALGRAMSALLFGVGPTDVVTYGSVSAALAGMTMLATWLPALRASRIEPHAALRAD